MTESNFKVFCDGASPVDLHLEIKSLSLLLFMSIPSPIFWFLNNSWLSFPFGGMLNWKDSN